MILRCQSTTESWKKTKKGKERRIIIVSIPQFLKEQVFRQHVGQAACLSRMDPSSIGGLLNLCPVHNRIIINSSRREEE